MGLSLLTPPAVEPLTVDDSVTKKHVYVDHDEDDAVLASYMAAARAWAETYTRQRFITQTVRLTLDGFGCGGSVGIPLPIAPIQSVSAVAYLDGAGTWQTLDAADYSLSASQRPNELRPAYGRTWPVPRSDADVVRIDLVVGFGDEAGDVPAPIMHAMRMLVAHWYTPAREASIVGVSAVETPMGVRDLLNPYRLWI